MECFMQDELATNEPKIRAEELIGEIFPLIKDYFIGDISFDGQAISYRLPNGQRFRISAQQA